MRHGAGPRDFLCRTRFIDGVVEGDRLTFWWPCTWHTGGGTVWVGSQPVQFLAGGAGKGTVFRTVENFGEFEDLGVNSEAGASFLNRRGRYHVAAPSTTGAKASGWLTNGSMAAVEFSNSGAGSHLRWSLHNEGRLGFGLGARARILGSWVQGPEGITTMSSNTLSVQSNLFLAGTLTGSGSITSRYVNGPNHRFRFGAVPPGYRFGLATNGASRTLSIIVTPVELPIASLEPGPGVPVGGLRVRTLAGVPYTVERTEQPGINPWQIWTNFVGDGEPWWLPFEPAVSRQFFRVQEGP